MSGEPMMNLMMRFSWPRRLGATGLLLLSLLLTGSMAPLTAAQHTPQMITINVPAKPEAPPALRLGANQPVVLHLGSDQRVLGNGMTDANGAISIQVPLPTDLTTGTYTIEVRGASAGGTPIAVTHQIDVTATAKATKLPSDSGNSLSSTTTLLAALSLGFVAANLVLIQRTLKRNRLNRLSAGQQGAVEIESEIQLN